jgi:circadian clock protein KaiB
MTGNLLQLVELALNMSTISTQPSDATITPTCVFRLYVAGEAPNSVLALRNLKALCKSFYGDDYHIDVLDILLSPERAWAEGVIVTPMAVRISPEPVIKIIGNLSNTEQVLNALNFVVEGHA